MPHRQTLAGSGKDEREKNLAPPRKTGKTKGSAGRSIAARKAARARTMRAKAH
jgi:hypothetical protein